MTFIWWLIEKNTQRWRRWIKGKVLSCVICDKFLIFLFVICYYIYVIIGFKILVRYFAGFFSIMKRYDEFNLYTHATIGIFELCYNNKLWCVINMVSVRCTYFSLRGKQVIFWWNSITIFFMVYNVYAVYLINVFRAEKARFWIPLSYS